MIDNSATIVTIAKNKEHCIRYFLKKTNNYQRKHKNIKRIIIYDDQSTDQTIPIAIETIHRLKNQNIIFLTNDKPRCDRIKMQTLLKQINTPNVIFIETELYTYLRNVTKQINLLKKSQIILPNRYHETSEVTWKDFPEPQHKQGLMQDSNNHNRAIKTRILKIMLECEKKNCWANKIIKPYKITQPPVEYNQLINHAYER
jgi:glycosyltransferase involved in cell wall biosynthesis